MQIHSSGYFVQGQFSLESVVGSTKQYILGISIQKRTCLDRYKDRVLYLKNLLSKLHIKNLVFGSAVVGALLIHTLAKFLYKQVEFKSYKICMVRVISYPF